jgi:hypothetical protein
MNRPGWEQNALWASVGPPVFSVVKIFDAFSTAVWE